MATPRARSNKNVPVALPSGPTADGWAPGLIAQETPDPLAALQDKELTVRTAACRDLSKIGLIPAIRPLADMARSDKSPAVRLGAAAAVADILSRYRLGPARAGLPEAERKALLTVLATVDPGQNSGMFMMLASLDTDEAARRIRLGLRDPRGEVRVGAGVGLLRLCCSASRGADLVLEAEVVGMFADPKLRPDALVEVARAAVAAGYRSALPAMERIDFEGAHQESINSLIQVMRGFDQPPTGVWVSDGRDAGEVNPAPPRPQALLVVGEGEAVMLRKGDDWLPLPGFGQRAARRMYFRRPGAAAAAPALQIGEHTFSPVTGEAAAAALLALSPEPSLQLEEGSPWATAGADMAARLLAPALPESAAGLLALGRLQIDAGDVDLAQATLARAAEAKKAGPEPLSLLGLLHERRGEREAALQAYAAAMERGKKRDPAVLLARARHEALGGGAEGGAAPGAAG